MPSRREAFAKVVSAFGRTPWLYGLVFIFAGLAGLGTQMNWIQEHCSGMGYLQNGEGVCAHNVLRMVLAPPAMAIAIWFLIVVIAIFLLRRLKQPSTERIVRRLTYSFCVLGGWVSVGFVGYVGGWLQLWAVAMLVVAYFLMAPEWRELRATLWPKLPGVCQVVLRGRRAELHLGGRLVGDTADAYRDLLDWQQVGKQRVNSLEIYSSELEEFDGQLLKALATIFVTSAVEKVTFAEGSRFVDEIEDAIMQKQA